MENLFRKLTQKNHILDSYAQVAEKYVLPEGDSYRKFNPGIDGRDLKEFEKDLEANLEDCRRFLLEGDRDFLPQILRQVPKSDPGKFREIYLQSLRDKILQKAMAEAIWPALEKRLSPNLFSYRLSPVYGQGAAVKRLKKFLEENANRGFVFKTDISDFTEHIRHDILRRQLEDLLPGETRLLALFDKFIRQRRYRDGKLGEPKVGIPTGSPLTPLMANLHLSDLDREMFRKDRLYFRYGDDILLVHADRQVVETGRAEIMAVLDERGLAVSADKTYLRSTEQDFHYLGYRFDLGRVRVGEKSLDRYRRWARTVLRKELYRNRPNGTPAQRKDLLRKILRDFHEEHFHADQALAWIKCFPFVDDDQDLKVLDSFIKERIRICVTRKASAKNFQSVPESWFRECGFRSLIGAYYRVQKRRPLGPYQDWEPYLRVEAGKKKAGPSSNLGKKIRRMKSWWGWLRRAVSDDSVDGNIPNG